MIAFFIIATFCTFFGAAVAASQEDPIDGVISKLKIHTLERPKDFYKPPMQVTKWERKQRFSENECYVLIDDYVARRLELGEKLPLIGYRLANKVEERKGGNRSPKQGQELSLQFRKKTFLKIPTPGRPTVKVLCPAAAESFSQLPPGSIKLHDSSVSILKDKDGKFVLKTKQKEFVIVPKLPRQVVMHMASKCESKCELGSKERCDIILNDDHKYFTLKIRRQIFFTRNIESKKDLCLGEYFDFANGVRKLKALGKEDKYCYGLCSKKLRS